MNRTLLTHLISMIGLIGATSNALGEILTDSYGNNYEIRGFLKLEGGISSTTPKIVPKEASEYLRDSRNAFQPYPAASAVDRGPSVSRLTMQQVTLGVSRETDSALTLETKATYRWRSPAGASFSNWFNQPDVDYKPGNGLESADYFEKLVGIGRPDLGNLRYGTQLSRSWSRSDAFTFPIGLSSQWADTGAGYGIFPEAIRYTSPTFEAANGKLTAEITLGTNERNTLGVPQNRATINNTAFTPGAPRPMLAEVFIQYSNTQNLIELIIQSSSGARQSSFGKSGLVGWIGDTDRFDLPGGGLSQSGKPNQTVALLQGNHWPNPTNMFTWGLRHNQWSGSPSLCNYVTVVNGQSINGCYYVDSGFNYGSSAQNYQGFRARNFDLMGGWSHYRGLWTYTLGGVYFGHAISANPIEWGQRNSALSLNMGLYRKLPEVHKGLGVYLGLSHANYERTGPAPISMPNNSLLGPNSLYDKTGFGFTVGSTLVF